MSSATLTPPTAAAAHRAEARRPSLLHLTAVELRKSTDTRAGRWLLVAVGLLALAGLAYRLWSADGPTTYTGFAGTALDASNDLLPVIGVLAMTSEWTQRTALTTYALVPRRGRVLVAKLASALVLSTAAVLVVAAVSALAALASAVVAGDGAGAVQWDGAGRLVAGQAASTALLMLMGAGFGALLQQTPAALVTYFVAPVLVTAAGAALLDDGVEWISVLTATARVGALDLSGAVAPTLTALALWIVLPLALGTLRTLRRDVS